MPQNGRINVDDSINSGQVFLWRKSGGFWYGVDGQDVLRADGSGGTESFRGGSADFFRRTDDIGGIVSSISRDPATRRAAKRYPGLRILRQDPFQCMISFIASSNSSIQKTRSSLEQLSKSLGDRVEYDSQEFFLFPRPEDIAGAPLGKIRGCGFGYRSKFIKQAARMAAGGRIDLEGLKGADYDCAKEAVCGVPGVGDKVADCILLFSLGKLEAFPLDRWTIRILDRYDWFELKTKTITGKQYGILHEEIVDYFGPYAGYAQQFLFKMERESRGRKWL